MPDQLSFPFSTRVGLSGNGSGFKDPAFVENRTAPVHRWVPWIAGFSGAFVDSVLAKYLYKRCKKALVLDPFAGVGTTLIQAAMRGYDVVGFEINPYAALVAETKLKAITISSKEVDRIIESMRSASARWRLSRPHPFREPEGFRSRIPFFSHRIRSQVLHALDFIAQIEDAGIRDLFRIAFGAVMVSFSNYTYEPSLSSRPGAGKPLIDDSDVAAILLSKLQQMRADIEWLHTEMNGNRLPTGRVYQEDFFEGQQRLQAGSIHLTITSPPYLNNYHYVRNTRPQLYWLSLITSPKDQTPLEQKNFGTYWQVARDKDHVELSFEHRGLRKILQLLRHCRTDKGKYGGKGWANYAASYFNDCDRFMAALKRVLARGGLGVIVVGNSIIQGFEVRVDEILGDIARQRGLSLESIYRIRDKRVGDSITASSVRRGVGRAALYESAVVVRKR
jgi:DNA modification methylase